MTTAMVGRSAPDFNLESTSPPGLRTNRVSLEGYRGRWLIVVFYPRDFSIVCPTELTALGEKINEFRAHGAEILGISTDSVESHERWIATPKSQGGLGDLGYPLASDADGSVARSYGVYLEYQHVALRGLFIIDPNGVLQYQVVHNLSVGRRADEVLRVLSAIQTGGLCGESWSVESPTMIDPTVVLGPGRVISHYRVENVIGTGSYSTVYRAHDLTLDRDVALKIFKNNDASRNKVALTEARAAASLNHVNIGTIFAIDDAEGASMIAMEYLRGRTLADHIAGGPIPPDRVAWTTRQIAFGMAAAHTRGLVHGDLKPANIMVTETGLVKILDFGLSRRQAVTSQLDLDATVDSADLEPSGISGTPSYLSPEQAQGEPASTASDVFALGVMVYEMLTGRKAFPGTNLLQVLNQISRVDPARLAADLPAPFDKMVRCALAIDPEDRGVCMAEIARLFPGAPCPLEVAKV
jgi:alkyl hydroperoxide reductase subunit AhpC/predicted Ser/Thr protein kinase